jgi:hypothetical protein
MTPIVSGHPDAHKETDQLFPFLPQTPPPPAKLSYSIPELA